MRPHALELPAVFRWTLAFALLAACVAWAADDKALLDAITAREDAVKASPPPPPDIRDPNTPQEIAPVKRALLDACERYLKEAPDSARKVEVAYKAARIYYEYNDLKESTARFGDIALNHPENSLCTIAGNLVIDAYNIRADTDEMNAWSCKLTKAGCAARNSDFKADMQKLCEMTTFKQANVLDTQQQYAKAAEAYVSFTQTFPKSDLVDKALFDAAVDFARVGSADKAAELRKRLVAEHRTSALVPHTVFALAEGYETADPESASRYYEDYAAAYEKSRGKPLRAGEPMWEEPKAKMALFNAGVLREKRGELAKALTCFKRYLNLWPYDPNADAIWLKIIDLHERNHDDAAARKAREKYEHRPRHE
jgi:TolA-binding protein